MFRIYHRLRTKRISMGLSVPELALRAGVTEFGIRLAEIGMPVSFWTYNRIQDALFCRRIEEISALAGPPQHNERQFGMHKLGLVDGSPADEFGPVPDSYMEDVMVGKTGGTAL